MFFYVFVVYKVVAHGGGYEVPTIIRAILIMNVRNNFRKNPSLYLVN